MDFETAMDELGALVSSPEFQARQAGFFDMYCDEFDGAEENKLSYTAIHNEYVEQVEKQIECSLGAEMLEMLCVGAEEYAKAKQGLNSKTAAEALDVLSSLADFEAFKSAMLAKKAAKHASGVELQAVKGMLNVSDVIDRTAELRQAVNEAEGWGLIADEPTGVFYMKPAPEGSSYLRFTIELELPPPLAFDMMINFSPESAAWRDKMREVTLVKDYGPNDHVVQVTMSIPWAVKYIMSLPEEMSMRIVSRENWPEPGDYAYAIVPFDLEKNVAVEEMGMLKMKTGVISPHPSDPEKSIFTGCDLLNVGMVPNWGLGFLVKKMSIPSIASMTANYKATKGLGETSL